ncbi:MAG: response regulator [Alkalinema sp. FL-bin-369]|nr:response regulator [Leptolyngbyaceae cyanobacterium LF-bin-369]
MKLLIIEDDMQLLEILKTSLKNRYVIDSAQDGLQGLQLVGKGKYDLILLDRSIDGIDGLEFCQQIRQQGNQVLVMIMSMQGSTNDRVSGLDAGADDYLVKPFALNELEARIRALLRRRMVTELPVLTWGPLAIEPTRCNVTYHGTPVMLTTKEYGILELLLRHQDRIYSQRALLDALWSLDNGPRGEETVRTHMKRLRQKLKPIGAGDLIETVYGLGYRLNPILNAPPVSIAVISPSGAPKADPSSDESSAIESSQAQLIAQFWKKQATKVLRRIQILDHSVQALQRNPSDDDLRSQIRQEGNILVGVMGSVCMAEHLPTLQALGTWISGAHLNTPSEIQVLHKQLGMLTQMLEAATSGNVIRVQETIATGERLPDRRILVVDGDREWVTQLMNEAYRWGIQMVRASDANLAVSVIERACPDAVILNASTNAGSTGVATDGSTDLSTVTIEFLKHLTHHCPRVPVWIVSNEGENDLDPVNRVAISKHWGQGFFRKSIPLATLMGLINQSLLNEAPRHSVPEAKILLVDDDRLMLSLLKGILEPWGMQVTTCNDPLQARKMLSDVKPDLMVLDFEMPEMNGIEVCQQTRNDMTTATLPILFLTAHRDADTIQKVFLAGADDYVSKPVIAPELMTRIFNRLERSQLFREQSQRDLLTQCWNQAGSQEQFELLIQESERLHQPVCFGVIGIQNLLSITRKLGYLASERILKGMADALRATLPTDSAIARWDSGEFVMLMPGMDARSGQQFLTSTIAQVQHTLDLEKEMQFSTGVSQVTKTCNTLMALYEGIAAF